MSTNSSAARLIHRSVLTWAVVFSLAGGGTLGVVSPANADSVARPVTVAGTIADADAQPVSEAMVSLLYQDTTNNAHIVRQTTKNDGRYLFRLTTRPYGDLTVVAWKAGLALGLARHKDSSSFGRSRMPRGASVELAITLERPKPLTLHVVDAEGSAVNGGLVGVAALSYLDGRAAFYWSEAKLGYLNREIDANGQVTLDYFPADYGAGLLVETDANGMQGVHIGHGRVTDKATVELLPTSTVNVTLSAEDASHVQDREVTVASRPSKPAEPDGDATRTRITAFRGVARMRTDQAGKATAVVAAGTARVNVQNPSPARLFPEESKPVSLQPGAVADVVVRLEPGIPLRGRVVTDQDSPVPGVELNVSNSFVRSGEDGSFEAWGPASRSHYIRVVDVPSGFVWPYETHRNVPNPTDEAGNEASKEYTINLPVVRVKQATAISGTVVDQSDKPLPWAHVHAAWVQTHDVHSYFSLKSDVAQTDSEGRFKLEHVLPDVDVRITARNNAAAVKSATIVNTSAARTVQLQVTPDGMVKLAGQAKGSDGVVIPHAEVKIVRAMLAPGGDKYGTRPVEWDGERVFTADEQGRFESPGTVPRCGKYSTIISAPGYLAVETEFLTPPAVGSTMQLAVAETTLTEARTATGTVRDSSGTPVSDALVWADAASEDGGRHNTERTRATTDGEGCFTLLQLHPKAAIAIVEKDGFRITGCPLLIGQPEVSFTLFRSDEQVSPEHAIRPVFDSKKRHAAARALLAKSLPQRRNSNYFHGKLVEMLARIDPGAVLAEVAETTSSSTRAKLLAKIGEIQDALAEAETVDDDYSRAFTRFAILDNVTDPDQARDILATTLVDANLIRRPDRRMVVIAGVAERFAKIGDTKQAEGILRAQLSQAKALSTTEWPGYARASFAERLSLFDPDTALAMVAEADPDDQTRHYQNIAHQLAAIKPAVAEATLKRISQHRYIDSPVVRVAYRMTPVDFPRALRLLDLIDERQRPTGKARGLAVMAYALKDEEPAKATELLNEAFETIPEQRGGGGSRVDRIIGASIALLRFAEEIDPDNLTDYYWRALKNYPGPSGGAWSPEDAEEEDAERQSQLALMLSLYSHSPALLEQIMEPVFEYWEGQIGVNSGRFDNRESTFMAMAMTDPERAVDWAIRFDEKLEKELRRRIPQPWEVIGNTLTLDREGLGKAITREVFHSWVIDEYD